MDLGNMEDEDARVKQLEKSLHSAETRAHEAASRAELLREQLERVQHDNRALTTEQERAAATERQLRLEMSQFSADRESERHKLRAVEAKLIAAESDARVSRLKVDTLESTLASAEAEAKWLGTELDRRSTANREKLRESSSRTAELQERLSQALAETESLRRQASATKDAYDASQKQLESMQIKARDLRNELDALNTGDMSSMLANNTTMVSSGRLEHGLAALQAQIEASQIQEAHLQNRFAEISRAYNDSCDRIEQQTKELQAVKETNLGLVKQISELEAENTINKNAAARLARQIQHLLINAQLAADSQPLLTSEEKQELAKTLAKPINTTAAMDVVFDRLGYFTDIAELLSQNEQQLRVLESLTQKCERYEAQDSEESQVVAEAKETIISLNTLVQDLQKERNVLRGQLSAQQQEPKEQEQEQEQQHEHLKAKPHNLKDKENDRATVLKIDLDLAKSTIERLEAQLSSVLESSANSTQRVAILTSDLAESREIAEQLRVEKTRVEAQCRLVQGQFDNQQSEIKELAAQRNALNQDYNDLRENFNAKDRTFEATQQTLVDQINYLRSEVATVRHELSESEAQIRSYASQREFAENAANNLKLELLEAKISYDSLEQKLRSAEKELKTSEERLHLRTLSFTTADSDKANKLEEQLAQAEAQIQDLRTLAADTQKEMDSKQAVFDFEKTNLEKQLAAAAEAHTKSAQELEALKNTPPDTTELDASMAEAKNLKLELAQLRSESADAAQRARTELQAAADKHAAAISDLESINETCKSKIAALETQVQTFTESLASEKQAHEQQTADLTKQYNALEASIVTLRNENAELSSNKESLLQQLRASVKVESTAAADHDADMDVSLEDKDPIIEMLKRDKQSLEYLYHNSMSSAAALEAETKSLKAALEKAEAQLDSAAASESSSKTAGSDLAAKLEETNANLLVQLQECTVQREQVVAELEALRATSHELEEKLRSAQAVSSTVQEELSLIKADRDAWRGRVGATDDEKVAAIQAQLTERDAQIERIRQETAAKLEQETQKSKLAMNQVVQLNSRIQELSRGSETKISEEIAKKNERIAYLENEINRISDELTEEEEKKKALGAEASTAKARIAELEGALRTAQEQAGAQTSSVASKAAEDRIKQLESELASAKANVASFAALETNLEAGGEADSKELDEMVQALSSKSSAEQVEKFRELVAAVTKDRIKGKTASILQQRVKAVNDEKEAVTKERDELSGQLAELKSNIDEVEKNAQKRMELKLKILQAKADKTQQTNEELKLTIRKLKGGDTNVNILTLPDGTTKAVSSGSAAAQDSKPQHQHQHQHQNQSRQQQQAQKRPQVQRNGSKQQNKRNNGGDDNDLNKRLREN